MNQAEIVPIFCTPIYISHLDRVFSKKENNIFLKEKTIKNIGNYFSKETFILNKSCFKQLKNEILLHIDNYINNIICPLKKINFYITQSWLNYSRETEFHHEHSHPNSFISGVLYIKANKENDEIVFASDKNKVWDIPAKQYNIFNSYYWKIPVEDYKLILFPSNLKHSVSIKKENNLRISLAFNVLIKGEIGDKKSLTYAKL
jgi:uncharacterized protein (TIGR02466 family)